MTRSLLTMSALVISVFACQTPSKNNEDNVEEVTVTVPSEIIAEDEDTTEDVAYEEQLPVEEELAEGLFLYEGAIDNKYPIVMVLGGYQGADDTFYLTGRYFYTKFKKNLYLSGTLKGNQMELEERNKLGKMTGNFSGTMTATSLKGTWKQNQKELPFSLDRSGKDYLEERTEGKFSRVTDPALRDYLAFSPIVSFPIDSIPTEYETKKNDLPVSVIQSLFDSDWEPGPQYGDYETALAVVTDKYVALIYRYEFFPGAFGIYNDTKQLITFGFDAAPISGPITVGGFENDSNMGGRERYSTSYSPTISANEIVLEIVNTYELMAETEEEEDEIKQTEKIARYTISEDGKINKVSEGQ